MSSSLVAISGATCTQDDAHVPPQGGGTYTITSTLQDFVFVNDIAVIVNSQTYSAHGTATCQPSTSLFYINDMAVVRDGNTVSHHHNNTGVDVGNQLILYSG